jgi:hypothetical protein
MELQKNALESKRCEHKFSRKLSLGVVVVKGCRGLPFIEGEDWGSSMVIGGKV